MKKIGLFIAVLSVIAGFAAINKVSLPYVISSSTSPKVAWIDANDQALRNGTNQTIDSTNRLRDTVNKYIYKRGFTGTGSVVYSNTPTILTPVIGSITGVSDAVTIASGDTLKADIASVSLAKVADLEATEADIATLQATSGNITSLTITNLTGATKAHVGLSNADNTSDLNKPISTATQTALNGKEKAISYLTITTTTTIDFNDIHTNTIAKIGGAAQPTGYWSNWPSSTYRFGTFSCFAKDEKDGANSAAYQMWVPNGEDFPIAFRNKYAGGEWTPWVYVYNSTKSALLSGATFTGDVSTKTEVKQIREISSTGTTVLDKSFSYIRYSGTGGTLTLPDATGSGFQMTVSAKNGAVVNIGFTSGDFSDGVFCSPSSMITLNGSCGNIGNITSNSITVTDCANNVWCVSGWFVR